MGLYKTALQNLVAANRLLQPKKWIKNELAQNCRGYECSPRNPKAHAFCALGAVRHINGPGEIKAVKILRQAARLEILARNSDAKKFGYGDSPIFTVNDKIGFAAVKSMFRRAIKLAKSV